MLRAVRKHAPGALEVLEASLAGRGQLSLQTQDATEVGS